MAKSVLLVVMDNVSYFKTDLGNANTFAPDRLHVSCPNTHFKAHSDMEKG